MQNQEEAAESRDPFIIIYNYRYSKKHDSNPNRPKRHPHDYSLDRKSIIMTRKMKAEL